MINPRFYFSWAIIPVSGFLGKTVAGNILVGISRL
jgi:hypothetical protein